MSTDNIVHHPAFGNQPVVNTVRVYTDSRKRKVVRLTKVRRMALKQAREREAAGKKLEAEADAKSARFVEEARQRIPAERRAEICDLATDLASLILRLDPDDMRRLIEQANYYIGRKLQPPA